MSRYIFILFSILLPKVCAAYTNILQQDRLKISEVGGSVNLSCITSKASRSIVTWMKQKLGEKPLQIATSYLNQPAVFHNGFDKDGRFKILIGADSFDLIISDIEPSDSATYYCSSIFLYDINFGDGTYLLVKGASQKTHEVLQQPVMNPVLSGDSATLECTVNTQGCSEEHSVYWFRQGSHPGLIFTHGESSSQCTRSSETASPTQSCVYKLPKNNLSLSDAGTYYCAVAACGQILFGNGSKLDPEDRCTLWSPAILALTSSNATCVFVIVIMGGLLCKHRQKRTIDATLNEAEDKDAVNYASLSFTRRNSSSRRTGKMNQDQSLYAKVKTHEKIES